MKNTYKKPGIALPVTMLAIMVLTVIMGAFFQAYRSHYSLTRVSISGQKAATGCQSVYEYVLYRLEHEKTWGSAPFTGDDRGDPRGPLIQIEEVAGTHRFTGSIQDLDVTFEGTLHTNITGAAEPEAAGVAAPHTAVCQVVCKSGDSTRQSEFTLQIAPLFDSSVLSRSNLNVDAASLKMRSRDRNRNFIRAEGDIYVPDLLLGRRSQFLEPDSNNGDANGMLWAKGEIHSYLTGGVGSENIDTAEELRDAFSNSNGKIVPNADSHFSIFDLQESQLKVPPTQKTVNVPRGRWNFVRKKANVTYNSDYEVNNGGDDGPGDLGDGDTVVLSNTVTMWVDVLEYYSDPDASQPSKVYRARSRDADLITQAPRDKVLAPGGKGGDPVVASLTDEPNFMTTGVDVLGYSTPVTFQEDNKLSFFSTEDPEVGLEFDLANQHVSADANALVEVKGPFHITSSTDPGAESDPNGVTPPPTLNLGVDPDAYSQKAVIRAEGDLRIERGVTQGLGVLISKKGDVAIQPQNTTDFTIDVSGNDSGLLIYAGDDVVLKNPDPESDWTFKGLVYARSGIRMEGIDREDATFEGTLVSLGEGDDAPSADPDRPNAQGIEFLNCRNIEFIYNSELLDAFVKALPEGRIQLETVVWKS